MYRERIQHINLDTGVLVEEVYLANGRRHRDPKEGPAHTVWDDATGEFLWQEYRWHGRLHREGGSAFLGRRTLKHRTIDEEYRRRGVRHRKSAEGPAEISRDAATGFVVSETYWENGVMHRDPRDGAASIEWDAATKHVTSEAYWVRGKIHRDPGEGPAVIIRDPATGAVRSEVYYVQGTKVAVPERPSLDVKHPGQEKDHSP
jgi:hypothetical protein